MNTSFKKPNLGFKLNFLEMKKVLLVLKHHKYQLLLLYIIKILFYYFVLYVNFQLKEFMMIL